MASEHATNSLESKTTVSAVVRLRRPLLVLSARASQIKARVIEQMLLCRVLPKQQGESDQQVFKGTEHGGEDTTAEFHSGSSTGCNPPIGLHLPDNSHKLVTVAP